MINIFLIVVLSVFMSSACAVQFVTMKVHVRGENGKPVDGVVVKGTFFQDQIVTKQLLSSHYGITNSDGAVELSGHEDIYVDLHIEKDGYYNSNKRLNVRGGRNRNVTILLRKKMNPIAMYAKHFIGYIPKNKTKIAFDFEKGDWVVPYGRGVRNDIYFYYDGYVSSFYDFGGKLTIEFPGDSDGLIGLEYKNGRYSELKMPYMAPIDGYKPSKILIKIRKTSDGHTTKENNLNRKDYFGYILRVRSKKDPKGKVIQSNFVKIRGEIIFDPRTEGKGASYIEMTYYYNPIINDRNLEFDPDQNLFRNLDHGEKAR